MTTRGELCGRVCSGCGMGENSSHVHLYLSGRFIIMILLLIADKYTVVGFVASSMVVPHIVGGVGVENSLSVTVVNMTNQ